MFKLGLLENRDFKMGTMERFKKLMVDTELLIKDGTPDKRYMLLAKMSYINKGVDELSLINFYSLTKSIIFVKENWIDIKPKLLDLLEDKIIEYTFKYNIEEATDVVFLFYIYEIRNDFVIDKIMGDMISKDLGIVKKDEVKKITNFMDDFSLVNYLDLKNETKYIDNFKVDILVREDGELISYVIEDITNGSTFKFEEVIKDGIVTRTYLSIVLKYDIKSKEITKNMEYKYNKIPRGIPDLERDEKFVAFDIETYLDENKSFIPYAIGLYTYNYYTKKGNYKTFYLTDFKDPGDMVNSFIEYILKYYNKYTFYAHNLSGFDGFILMKYIDTDKFKVKPIIKDNRIYMINIKDLVSDNRLKLLDSLLLINSSLAKAAKSFNLESKLGFPYKFPNENNLNYVGPYPKYEDYDNCITLDEYEAMKLNNNDLFDIRKETLIYLHQDCKILFEVIQLFSRFIYENYKLNITKSVTISSLSFRIYLSNFYKGNIPIIKGPVAKIIKEAFYGGVVDIYKPEGKDLFYYDVNSLYPYVMLHSDFPIGNAKFTSNKDLNTIFGFVRCRVEVKDLYIGTLPARIKKRLVNPMGIWEGWYFSEEIKQAVNEYGYKVKILETVEFKKGRDLFKKFVKEFYDLKVSGNVVEKNCAKLIMNSLYGRFGLNPINESTDVMDKVELLKFKDVASIIDIIEIDPDKNVVTYESYPSDIVDTIDRSNLSSIAISACIASYSRIYMNRFKDENTYYTDTDSIVTSKELPPDLVGKKIGQFKLEYKIKYGVFPQPKVYGLITEEGKTIIKSKGLGGVLTIEELQSLLKDNTIVKYKNTFQRSKKTYEVELKNVPHTLTNEGGFKKRIHVFKGGVWVETKPLNAYYNDLK